MFSYLFKDDSYNNSDVKTKGFKLTSQQSKEIRKFLTRIEEMAPSNSFTNLTLEKIGHCYFGGISINSYDKTISSNASSTSLIELCRILERNVSDKLFMWKVKRFDHCRVSREVHV